MCGISQNQLIQRDPLTYFDTPKHTHTHKHTISVLLHLISIHLPTPFAEEKIKTPSQGWKRECKVYTYAGKVLSAQSSLVKVYGIHADDHMSTKDSCYVASPPTVDR